MLNEQKMKEDEKGDHDQDNTEMEYYIDFLDNIHCYFLHSYDTGFRISTDLQKELLQTYDDGKELDLDFNTNDIKEIYVSNTLKKLKDYLSTKKSKMSERLRTNKFMTIHQQTQKKIEQVCENEEQDSEVAAPNAYSFGMRFYYWPWFKIDKNWPILIRRVILDINEGIGMYHQDIWI